MKFSDLLKGSSGGKPSPQSIDACAMVNGKLSNAQICDDMLEGEKDSPEVTKYLIENAITMGFTPEQAQKYWG
jgi:hypothetical protein